MEAGSVSSIEICAITQCSICLETFKEPKALPCIHTFCLMCLDKHCENQKQEEVACPLCRKVFIIPPGGNRNLPANFFILQLLQVKQSTNEADEAVNKGRNICELCKESSTTSFCIECDQHICDRCSAIHTNAKACRSHQVVSEADIPCKEELKKVTLRNCDQHPAEHNRFFCNDCKMVACPVCFINNHMKHDFTDVNISAGKVREQMKDDVENVSACAVQELKKIKQLEIDTKVFLENISATHSEISQKHDELVSRLRTQHGQLIDELNAFKDKILKKVETKKSEIEREFVIRESFKRYCQELMDKGTACDISHAGHDLHARAEELVKTRDEPDCHKLSTVEIIFRPFLSIADGVDNFIGQLVFRDKAASTRDTLQYDFTKFLENPTLLHVKSERFLGITVLGSEVFVTRATPQVNVYKSDDFTLIRNLDITGSKDLRGMASCSHYNCLYVSDHTQKNIYRYDLANNTLTTNWSVSGTCYYLSLTKCNNILATLYDTNRIQEYTTHGNLIREITLDTSIDRPQHCVQLSTGNYAISHNGTQQRRVCIVDQNGCINQSYGGFKGSGVEQLDWPRHLAIDVNDNVLIVDSMNHRVQLLSSTLTYLGDIVIPRFQLYNPYTLHFDELNHRLYICEWLGCRMFVLEANT